MFKILLLIAPAFIRDNVPNMIKWAKYLAAVSVLVALACFVYSTIQENNKRELENIQSRALIALQDKKIQEQLEIVEKMKNTLNELKASHEVTMVMVSELQQEQQRIEHAAQDKKRLIDAKLKQIDGLNITQVAKDIKKNQALIKGLNETYCGLFSVACADETS